MLANFVTMTQEFIGEFAQRGEKLAEEERRDTGGG